MKTAQEIFNNKICWKCLRLPDFYKVKILEAMQEYADQFIRPEKEQYCQCDIPQRIILDGKPICVTCKKEISD